MPIAANPLARNISSSSNKEVFCLASFCDMYIFFLLAVWFSLFLYVFFVWFFNARLIC